MRPNDAELGQHDERLRRLQIELDQFVDVFARRHAMHRTDLDALGHLWEAEVATIDRALGALTEATSALTTQIRPPAPER